jgi:hypothetical protein
MDSLYWILEEKRFCKARRYLLEIWLYVVINRSSAGMVRFFFQPGFGISVPVLPQSRNS